MTAGLPPAIGQAVTVTRRPAPALSAKRLGHRDRIDWHVHGEHQLVYPRAGVLIAATMAGTWILPPQRALWLPAEVPHSHQAHGATGMRTVSFPPAADPPGFTRPTVLAVSPLMREAMIALTQERLGKRERENIRLFREQTGMTFPQWRAQVRLHHGVRHLASGAPVTAVAHQCGYANASAFVEAFRLATGTTPGAYQRGLALSAG
jgi:AraC-like DNA-binding protein